MMQRKLMTFIYWLGIIYFAVRIMLSYLLLGKVESELIFQVFGFWSFLILLLLLMMREHRRTGGTDKKGSMIVLLLILAAALAVVSIIYVSGLPIFILVSLGSGLLLLFLYRFFSSAGTGPGEKKGRVAGLISGAASFCLLIGLMVFAFGYNKTDTELILPIIGFWLCFIFANAFFLSLKGDRV